MATSKALPRPGLLAHRESLNLSFADLVSRLADAIGRKLTAYVAGVKDTRAVERWMTTYAGWSACNFCWPTTTGLWSPDDLIRA